MIPDATIDVFQGSFRRCQASATFFACFYDRFVASSPEVATHFAQTDMRRQRMVLQASFQIMLLAARESASAAAYLESIALRHSRTQLNIRPELYELWLDSLIWTVSQTDSAFTPEVEAAWRAVMLPGIECMRSRYDSPAKSP